MPALGGNLKQKSHPPQDMVAKNFKTAISRASLRTKAIEPGDLTVSRLRWYLKETAVVRTTRLVISEFIVLRPHAGVDPEVLMVLLRSFPLKSILILAEIRNLHPRFNIGVSAGVPDGFPQRWAQPYRHWQFIPSQIRF